MFAFFRAALAVFCADLAWVEGILAAVLQWIADAGEAVVVVVTGLSTEGEGTA